MEEIIATAEKKKIQQERNDYCIIKMYYFIGIKFTITFLLYFLSN